MWPVRKDVNSNEAVTRTNSKGRFSMFKRFKAWLRATIEDTLRGELKSFVAEATASVNNNLQEFDRAAKLRLEEMLHEFDASIQKAANEHIHTVTKAHLENTRNDLVQAVLTTLSSPRVVCHSCNRLVHSFTRTPQGVKCTDCVARGFDSNEFSHWKADPQKVEADLALQKVK